MTTINFRLFSSHQKEPLTHKQSTPPSWVINNLFCFYIHLPVLDISYQWNLLSLHIMFSRVMRFVAYISASFLFIVE